MQIHLALSEPPDWYGDERLARTAIVHVTPGLDGVSRAVNEAERGLLPAEATIVCGQPCAVDPSRAPDGSWIVWIQLQELPRRSRQGRRRRRDRRRRRHLDRGAARGLRRPDRRPPRPPHPEPRARDAEARRPLAPRHRGAERQPRRRRHLRRLVRARPELPLPPAPAGARTPHGRRRPLAHRRVDAPGPGSRRRLRLPRLQGADEGPLPRRLALAGSGRRPVKLSLSEISTVNASFEDDVCCLRGRRLRRDRDLGDEAARGRRGERRAPARGRARRRELRPGDAVDPPAWPSRAWKARPTPGERVDGALRERAAARCVRARVRARAHRARDELEPDEARRRHRRAFARSPAAAREAGVRLGLEPAHPAQHDTVSFVNSIADALALLDEAGPRRTSGLMADTYNLWHERPETLARRRRARHGSARRRRAGRARPHRSRAPGRGRNALGRARRRASRRRLGRLSRRRDLLDAGRLLGASGRRGRPPRVCRGVARS